MATATGAEDARTSPLDVVPLLRQLRTYQPGWLAPDVLAALTVWALLVPQALAYADLAGLSAVVGLYAAIGGLIGYAIFGGVRAMSVGPEATIALLTATIVGPLALGDPLRYVTLAATLALVSGIVLVLGGLARLGFVARYLSRPLLVGYVTGSAIIMIVGQLSKVTGIQLETSGTVDQLLETIRRIPDADTLTVAVALMVMAIIFIIRGIDRRLPAYLVAVLVAIALSNALDLQARGVAVVGTITPGLPPIGLPEFSASDLSALLAPAAAMALLIFADSGVTGQVLGRRGGYRVDANGEFIGLGAANIGASLTGGFPVNGSQSRSFTAADVGVRTQLAGLLVVAMLLVTLLFLTPFFAPLPEAALGAVIIVVALGLLDVPEFRRIARVDRSELGLAILAATVVVVVGMLAGVFIVVLLSLLLVAQQVAQPRTSVLVNVPGTDSYRSVEAGYGGVAAEGIAIYRFDAPLMFANASLFSDEITRLVGASDPPVRWVIVSCEAVTSIDSTAVSALSDLLDYLEGKGVVLALARVKAQLRAVLDRAGLTARVGDDHIFLEVDDAVAAAREAVAREPTTRGTTDKASAGVTDDEESRPGPPENGDGTTTAGGADPAGGDASVDRVQP